MRNSEIASLVRQIADTAKRNGNDMLVIESMGPKTLITCERRMSAKESWTEELDVAFSDLEFMVLDVFEGDAHWDARPTSKGIRVFGKQSTRLDAICNAPHQPKRAPMLGLPTTFQKQGVHREPEQMKPQPEPPRFDPHFWDDPD